MNTPYVIDNSSGGRERQDIFSRLLQSRIIMLTGEIDDDMSALVCAELLYLASTDKRAGIQMYINSSGGSVSAGLAIYDTMDFIPNDISTICMGTAASMAAVLLSSGTKGRRFCLPHSEVMIHQPLSGTGAQTQVSDIEIMSKHALYVKERTTRILADNTGRNYREVEDACDRDHWFTPEGAVEFGLADKVIDNTNEI